MEKILAVVECPDLLVPVFSPFGIYYEKEPIMSQNTDISMISYAIRSAGGLFHTFFLSLSTITVLPNKFDLLSPFCMRSIFF